MFEVPEGMDYGEEAIEVDQRQVPDDHGVQHKAEVPMNLNNKIIRM